MWTTVSGYCAVISIIVGIIGLILSGFCVRYSRKAYEAAQAIFEKGILMDKQKILDEVCLDFVMGFIIPYNDFKAEMNRYWDPARIRKNSEIKVSEIQASLRDKGFKSDFPYYQQHKGDVWDALDSRGESQRAAAFRSIVDFEVKVGKFNNNLKLLTDILNNYMNTNPDSGEDRSRDTLEDFYSKKPNDHGNIFSQAQTAINSMDVCIESLSGVLDIKKYQSQLTKRGN